MKTLLAVILMAGLAPMAGAAGLDEARASRLPAIDAATIFSLIQDSRNSFPQPGPAGCGWIRLTSSQVEALLKDRNPDIRKAGLRSARYFIQNNSINELALKILKDKNERADLRVEAARALSYATGYLKVQDAFIDLLKYGNEPRELRVMTYKALFSAVVTTLRCREFVLDAVDGDEKDRDARLAAIWALFDSVGNIRPRDMLVDIVKGKEEDAARIEAIKSLYGAVGNYSVRDLFQDLAKDTRESKPVRIAAIKALSGAGSIVQSFLKEMIDHETDSEIKVAAIEASSPDMAAIRVYFHLGYQLADGTHVSPIERE